MLPPLASGATSKGGQKVKPTEAEARPCGRNRDAHGLRNRLHAAPCGVSQEHRAAFGRDTIEQRQLAPRARISPSVVVVLSSGSSTDTSRRR